MIIQAADQKQALVEAGRRLAEVLEALRGKVAPGMSAEALDDFAEEMIRDAGDTPAFLGYTPEGAKRAYPATLCVSINDEVVHGIPNESSKVLKDGDIVSFDLGLRHQGIIVDAAITVAVGEADEKTERLIAVTREALDAGIAQARLGNRIGDISHAIQTVIESAGFTVVKDLGGHGVGERVHEEPFVANFGRAGTGPRLVEGMVLALEPIAAMGKGAITLAPDGYTYRMKDGSLAAHFEHTILIEAGRTRIITA